MVVDQQHESLLPMDYNKAADLESFAMEGAQTLDFGLTLPAAYRNDMPNFGQGRSEL
jgi:hypothetical protein